MKTRKFDTAFEIISDRTEFGGDLWNKLQKDLKEGVKTYMQMIKDYPGYEGYINKAFA